MVWLGASLCLPAIVRADASPRVSQQLADTMASMASEIERVVALSKPADWETAHSCLYYAFAGQHLLAQRGIAATLWVGTVVYDPGTSTRHGITPHAWLETATHFIDAATLPRWGAVTVIPLELVATNASQIIPGETQVLVRRRPGDRDLLQYLAEHRARFEDAVNSEH